jgi:hypothetical protein
VVERDVAWASRFQRLARDNERLDATMAGFHDVAFALCWPCTPFFRCCGCSESA